MTSARGVSKYPIPLTVDSGSIADNNAFTLVDVQLPINKIPQGNQITIVEICKIVGLLGTALSGATTDHNHQIYFLSGESSVASEAAAAADSRCFDFFTRTVKVQTAVGFSIQDNRFELDYDDGSGHGVLIASDQITIGISQKTGGAQRYYFKIWFNFVTVSLSDYIQMVTANF